MGEALEKADGWHDLKLRNLHVKGDIDEALGDFFVCDLCVFLDEFLFRIAFLRCNQILFGVSGVSWNMVLKEKACKHLLGPLVNVNGVK